MRKYSAGILLLFISNFLFAQQPGQGGNRGGRSGQMPTGSFYGKIVDSITNKPVELASVQLIQSRFDTVKKTRKDVVIGGMLTKANGEFRIENIPAFGQYKLRISVGV